jgi:DNA replication protein DnaC
VVHDDTFGVQANEASLTCRAWIEIDLRPGSVEGSEELELQELAIARADGTYAAELGRLSRFDVLVLDDFLIAPMKDSERRDLFEVIEDRYDRTSTVITTQLMPKTWHEALGDPTIADAICDRLVHNAHTLRLTGPSIREKKGLKTKSS